MKRWTRFRFSWFNNKANPAHVERTAQVISQILAEYGALLERYPLAILDTSMLPLPKDRMKAVLKAAWLADTDKKRRNALEIAFVELSSFQDGVGDNPIHYKLSEDDDMSTVVAILTPWLTYSTRVNSEVAVLVAEFQNFKRDCSR